MRLVARLGDPRRDSRIHLLATAAQCWPATQHPYPTLHHGRIHLRAKAAGAELAEHSTLGLGRIHLLATAAQCWPATQHPHPTFHHGRIHLLATAAKKGSVSQPLSIYTLRSIWVGFTYKLQQRRREVLATQYPRNTLHLGRNSLTPCRNEGG